MAINAAPNPKTYFTVNDLLSLAVALGASSVGTLSEAEQLLAADATVPLPILIAEARSRIASGEDPLGDAFCSAFSSELRRPKGATYTPQPIVDSMLAWAKRNAAPKRIVDPGAGSGRFLVAAGREFPEAELVASEIDPLAALMARGHLAEAGMANRSRVVVGDFRELALENIGGQTLYIGNPPYVRHHLIDVHWKSWLTRTAKRLGHDASQLAGLHVHFFLAIAERARPGDIGILITAAEWLDVNYGRLVRQLLVGRLGAQNLQVIEPSATPFPGTQTTAVITGFEVGSKPESIGLNRVASSDELGQLNPDRYVRRERLESDDRWSPLTRAHVERKEGFVELGELCRVHRGAVTGANRIWVADDNRFGLPDSVLYHSVTRARELFALDGILDDLSPLRRVIDLPIDLDVFDPIERRKIEKFLRFAKANGVADGFIASHRKAWWSVGLRQAAPILATYMARRPPVFVRNLADARHINIAHGIYPRTPLDEAQLSGLASYLSRSVSLHDGRTYAGGLTKFEPREMERLLVPTPELITEAAFLGEAS